MKILSRNEAQIWCEKHGGELDDSNTPVLPSHANHFEIPSDAGHRVALVKNGLEHFRDETESLIWFTEWGVWPSSERMHIFERFRLSYGEQRPLIESPGHLFASAEHEELLSFATLGVLFLWDLFVLNHEFTKMVFYSHDEYGYRLE